MRPRSARLWTLLLTLGVGLLIAVTAYAAADVYEPDDTWQTARTITVDGVEQEHTIDPDSDVDWVKFTAERGRPYRISLSCSSYVRLYLYAQDGTTLLDWDTDTLGPHSDKELLHASGANGELYVKVDRDGGTEDYSIAVTKIVSDAYEPDDTPAAAKPITTDGVAQHRAIDPEVDVDWIRFSATQGHPYRISLAQGSSDSRFNLYASDGTTLLGSDNYGTLLHYASLTGTLYIKAMTVGAVGDYAIDVRDFGDQFESDNSTAAARAIGTDGSMQLRGIAEGDEDWAFLDANDLTSYTVEIVTAGTGIDARPMLELYASDGVTRLGTDDESIDYVAETARRLYVRVCYDQEEGLYKLRVRRTPSAVLFTLPSDSVVDMGDVAYGSTTRRTITICNAGGSALNLDSVRLTGNPSFSLVGAPTTARSLAPGTSVTLDVACAPDPNAAGTGPPTFATTVTNTPIETVFGSSLGWRDILWESHGFRNTGGDGTATLSWSVSGMSGSGTQTVTAGATYAIRWLVQVWEGHVAGYSETFRLTLPGTSWSDTLDGIDALSAGHPALVRCPDAWLTVWSGLKYRTWGFSANAVSDGSAPTYLSIKASPTALSNYGAATTVSGTLRAGSSSGAALSGQPVYVQTSSNGTTEWKDAKTLTTRCPAPSHGRRSRARRSTTASPTVARPASTRPRSARRRESCRNPTSVRSRRPATRLAPTPFTAR